MKLNEHEMKDGMRWFYGAGAVAILLVIFLRFVDDRLTHSPRERVLGETLSELRSAQFSLPARATDDRATWQYGVRTAAEARGTQRSPEHH